MKTTTVNSLARYLREQEKEEIMNENKKRTDPGI